MRIYIATGLANAHRAQLMRDACRANGHTVTYDWTAHGPVGRLGQAVLTETAQNELRGVALADLVIAILPGGRGTHGALTAGRVLGKPVINVDELGGAFTVDDSTCAFYWHHLAQRVSGSLSDPATLAEVLSMARNAALAVGCP